MPCHSYDVPSRTHAPHVAAVFGFRPLLEEKKNVSFNEKWPEKRLHAVK
jgi:hypothetical protein